MRYLGDAFSSVVILLILLVFAGCKEKEKVDEIVPLKIVMGVFERGVLAQNKSVLDSVYASSGVNRDSLINSLLEEFSSLKAAGSTSGGKVENLQFTRRRFSIPEGADSARVEFSLGGENIQAEKNLEVFLKKSKGEWKVVGQEMK